MIEQICWRCSQPDATNPNVHGCSTTRAVLASSAPQISTFMIQYSLTIDTAIVARTRADLARQI
jgi:hypothetical protein